MKLLQHSDEPGGSQKQAIDRNDDGIKIPSNLREIGHSWAQRRETAAWKVRKFKEKVDSNIKRPYGCQVGKFHQIQRSRL
jgi:hypothetical protein